MLKVFCEEDGPEIARINQPRRLTAGIQTTTGDGEARNG